MDDIHSKVDRLIQNNDGNDGHRLKRWHILLLFVVMLSLGSVIAIPFFQRKDTPFDAQEYLVDELNKSRSDLGANPLNGSAYNYWYAPPGSFGINQTKTVNFTFWKTWLKKYFLYQLEARQNNESTWQNANELLNVSLLFNQTNNTCKVTLTLNTSQAPASLYYRFTLVANRSVISHINKSVNYQYTLNLSANATENYSLVYNYSDLVPYIQSGKITIKQGIWNNYFYQRIKTNKKIAVNKTFVIDPNFGYEGAAGNTWSVENNIRGTEYTMGATGGTADNITAKIKCNTAIKKFKYAIYNNVTSALVGYTEEKSMPITTAGYETLNITWGGTLVANTVYWLCAWCESGGGAGEIYIDSEAGYTFWGDSQTYNGFPNPCVKSSVLSNYRAAIYCSYTESGWSNSCPSIDNEHPVNTSIDIARYINGSVIVWDADGNSSLVTWWNNKTGSWVKFQQDNSIVANGTATCTNFTFATAQSTKYWWRVYAFDGHCNSSAIFEFTTDVNVSAKTWHQTFTNNFSYSNSASLHQAFSNNFSYSNSATLHQAFTNNFSYSNTTMDRQVFTNNFSYSNTSEVWQQIFTNNFSYSNTSEVWHQEFANNFSYSNTSEIWQQQFTNNFSYSNDSVPIAWYQQFTNNFSYSNSTPPLFTITNEYPANLSNIYVTQPTVYFNLTHPNGYTMNYSLYINNNTLVYTGNNVSNGTQVDANHLFYSANTTYVSYFWRIAANDGNDWVNETFTFQAILQEDAIITTPGFEIFTLLGAVAISILLLRRRKK